MFDSSFYCGIGIGAAVAAAAWLTTRSSPSQSRSQVVTKGVRYILRDPSTLLRCIQQCPMLIHIGEDFAYTLVHKDTPGVWTDDHLFKITYQSEAAKEFLSLPTYPTTEQVTALFDLCTLAETDLGIPPPITSREVFDTTSGPIDHHRLVMTAGDASADPNDLSDAQALQLLRQCFDLSDDGGDGRDG